MAFTCFSSSHPAALKAFVLYDDAKDNVNLWSRNQSAALPHCSSSSAPPASTCLLCIDKAVNDVVTGVCNGVKVAGKLMLEAREALETLEVPIDITLSSGCPELLPEGDSALPSDVQMHTTPVDLQWLCLLIPITILVIIGIVYWKRCRKPQEHSGNDAEAATPMSPLPTSTSAANGDVTAANGDVTAANGDVTAANGDVTAANGDVTAANGDVTAANGDVTAANGDVTAANGDVTAANGDVTAANGDVTAANGHNGIC